MFPTPNSLRQILRDLRSQKLRTFLTVCGIVWGTVAISLLLAFGQGFHKQLIKTSRGLGNNIVIAFPSRTSLIFEGLGKGRRIVLYERDIELLKARATSVGMISGESYDSLKLQHGRQTLAVDVSGVEPVFGQMRNIIPAAGGRFINPIDEKQKRRVAFLGNELAEDLFGAEDPVGLSVHISGSPFLIIGVMQKKNQDSNYSGNDAGKLYIPASTFHTLTGQRFIDIFIFAASDLALTEYAKEEVQTILASAHRFDPDDTEAISMWDTTEMGQFLDTFMLAFQLFLGVVGSLTLVVGGIGVSNIMNVVVEERTREIGIKMALGGRPAGILGQFLGETIFITGTGGLLGLAIAAAACAGFPALGLTDFVGDPDLSPIVAGGTALLLGVISLVAGYFPARTAANLDPVVAMKM
jgi:putative ABC transport system permease protein